MPRSSRKTLAAATLFAFLGAGAIAIVVEAGEAAHPAKEAAKEAPKEAPKEIAKEAPKEGAKPSAKETGKPGDKGAVGDGAKGPEKTNVTDKAEKPTAVIPAIASDGKAALSKDAAADNAAAKAASGARGGADAAKKGKDKKGGKNDDQGPPLDIKGLRAEVRREAPPPIAMDSPEPPETKVEKMLSEVTKAREALHADTMRLEALLAQENDQAPTPGPAGAPGKGAAKPPLEILAKALRGIKPDQAAPIVSRLDRHLASIVLMRMPPVDAGKILGVMKPEVAAEISTLIALKKVATEGRAEARK